MRLLPKSLLLIMFFCFLTNQVTSQQKQIDALKEQLKNVKLSDSIKIKYLGDI